MKRTTTLRLERLEDRTTPSTTTTISFVPDGTVVGTQHSQLFADAGLIPPATWQQQLFNNLQQMAGQSGVTLKLASDDGASMNAPAPQDGAIRVAAVDQLFESNGTTITASPGYSFEVLGGAVTFGSGLGLVGPNGTPLSPAPQTPGNPSASLWPLILPLEKAYGNLYPSQPAASSPPPSSPPPSSGTNSPQYSYPSSPTSPAPSTTTTTSPDGTVTH
jgi:hypothetical protein